MTKAGNYYDWEIDEKRFYSQDEIDKINKEALDEFLQKKDSVGIGEYKYFGELKYNLSFRDKFIYAIELGKLIEELSKTLESELIFILDYAVPWLSQKNEYNPVQNALIYLKEIGTTECFTGAYKIKGDELAEFVPNLFWIIRCNASLPYCWFSTNNHEFIGDICEHGNIHLHTYSQEIKDILMNFAIRNNLTTIEECVEAFITDGGIDGRQIIVDK